jgi:hypothetical protein
MSRHASSLHSTPPLASADWIVCSLGSDCPTECGGCPTVQRGSVTTADVQHVCRKECTQGLYTRAAPEWILPLSPVCPGWPLTIPRTFHSDHSAGNLGTFCTPIRMVGGDLQMKVIFLMYLYIGACKFLNCKATSRAFPAGLTGSVFLLSRAPVASKSL